MIPVGKLQDMKEHFRFVNFGSQPAAFLLSDDPKTSEGTVPMFVSAGHDREALKRAT